MKYWRLYSAVIVLVFTAYSCVSPMSTYVSKTRSLANYEAELNGQNIPAETKSRLYWSMAKIEFPEYASFIDNILVIELAVVNKPEKTTEDLLALNKMKVDFWSVVRQNVMIEQEVYNKNINDILMWSSSIVYNASKAYIEIQEIKHPQTKPKQEEAKPPQKPQHQEIKPPQMKPHQEVKPSNVRP